MFLDRQQPADVWQGDAQPEKPVIRHRYRLAVAAALAVIIFFVDTLTTLGSAIAVLYVLILLLVGETGDRTAVRLCSLGCAALTVFSFVVVHGTQLESQAFLRLMFSLAANVVTTLLLLRRSRDMLVVEAQSRLLELTSDAIFLRDISGDILYWNKGAEDLYGWPARDALGKNAEQLLHMQFPVSASHAQEQLRQSGQWEGELRITTRGGKQIDIFSRWRLEHDDSDKRPHVLETSIDISQRKTAEAALKQSELRYRTIFETLAVAIWEHDLRDLKAELVALRARGVTDLRKYLAGNPDFMQRAKTMVHITDVNQTALTLMGVATKELFFTNLDQFLHENDKSFAQFLIALAEEHPTYQSETVVRSLSGKAIPVICVFSFPPNGEGLDRIQASIIDITERLEFADAMENSRRDLEHASRAAIIGEISASIAHEVNQPLAANMAFVQAAQRWLQRTPPDLEEVRLALADAVVSAEHASDVVKRVRMLLGKAKPDTGEVRINAIVGDALHLKQMELSAQSVGVICDLYPDDIVVQGDRVLLQQIFINLISNAMQAMETTGPAERLIAIETRLDGTELIVRFTDTGPGLGEHAAESLFKAFNTTKPNGMGLGLAMCRSIAMAHNGSISIANREDRQGAVVEIRIPQACSATPDQR